MNYFKPLDINIEYNKLLENILYRGNDKQDRTGTGTISTFGNTIGHSMSNGFPLLLGKKVSFNAVKTELLWILQGRTDLKYLEDNGVKYWRPDYERSGRTDETLGPVYGKQWRDFEGTDQLKNLMYSIRSEPSSRRLMINAWAPHEIDKMVLPPCHYAFQVYINNGIMDLMWQQRSADVFLGLPYDIAMYGLLLEMLAEGANLIPGRLIGQLGDSHLYNNHLNQAREFLLRHTDNIDRPILKLSEGLRISSDGIIIPEKNQIKLINYNPLPAIKADLSVGNKSKNVHNLSHSG
jgi:thymidylate synthase